ncbi:cellulase family glycosylhydrolase [Streptomyces sp. NPDC002004]
MRLRRAATALALGTTLLCAAPTAAPAQPGTPTAAPAPRPGRSDWAVPTGTVTTPDGIVRLADRYGRALRLHGPNLGKTDTVTRDRVALLSREGFTLMRLNIQWEKVEPRRGHYDTAYLRHLDRVLDWADDYRVLVLVDWHQDVYGPAFGHNGIPAWATRTDGLPFEPNPDDWFADYFQPAVQAAFTHLYDDTDLRTAQAAAYAEVARTLRGHRSLLGYDLFNEPFGPVPGDPADPADLIAASAALEQGRLAALYRRLIVAVRGADRDAWLFVEPTVLVGQGVPTRLPGFDDPRPGADRIGYAPHAYDTAVEAGRDWDPTSRFVEDYEAAVAAYPAEHRLPVVVGEWGPPKATTPGNAELIRRQLRSLQGFATGWAVWYDCDAADGGGYCIRGADGRPAPGKEGVFAPYARAVAGAPGDETYDATTGTFTLTLTADRTTRRARTALTLPAAAFPHGARVTVDGAGHAVVHADSAGAQVLLPDARPGAEVTVTAVPR